MEGSLPFGEAELMETRVIYVVSNPDIFSESLPFGEAELMETRDRMAQWCRFPSGKRN